MEYKDIVYSVEGFYFEKDELFEEDDVESDSVFYSGKTLEEALLNRYEKKIGWFHMYSESELFDSEEEALEDALIYAKEGSDEYDLLWERYKQLNPDEQA